MNARTAIVVLLGAWLLAVAMSFLHASVVQPTGFGFNVIEVFLTWQIVALVISLVLLITRLIVAPVIGRVLRVLGIVPITLTVLFWCVIGAYIATG